MQSIPTDYRSVAARIERLSQSLTALASAAQRLGVAPPDGREWFELLRRKLLPQIQGPPLLIAAIVGGTNIGKSVVFNHLAGETASAATPLAAGTKHPVCLVPPGCDDPDLLRRLFEHFEIRAWHSPDDPLHDAAADRIYWRVGRNVPPRLVLIDAPDVDSDVTVNWQRARAVRQTSDVLIAVLTQQKYNDAAVKQFFRAAVEADKPIIVIFNFCDLEADRQYWPQWLARFRAETGADPELVYVVPYDRAAADELRLPFFRYGPPLPSGEGRGEGSLEPSYSIATTLTLCPSPGRRGESKSSPTDLRDELAALHFDAIKIRTFRGALERVLDAAEGLPAYLAEVRAQSRQFAAAASALSLSGKDRLAWPSLPSSILIREINQWWDANRSEWSRRIHGVYRAVGRGIKRSIAAAWSAVAGSADEDPLAAFQAREKAAAVAAVEKALAELERLSQVGNEILRPRLARLLSGHSRQELLDRLDAAHRAQPAVDDEYRAMLRAELDAMQAAHPRFARSLRLFDSALAVARPLITVTFAVSGGAIAQQAAMHVASHVATEVFVDSAMTEAFVTASSEGAWHAAKLLLARLHQRFGESRSKWLAEFLEKELLGDLLADLRRSAAVADSREFTDVEVAMANLEF